jgi:hypothetical protein
VGIRWRSVDSRGLGLVIQLRIGIVAEDVIGERNVQIVGEALVTAVGHRVEWRERIQYSSVASVHRTIFGQTRKFHGKRDGNADEVIVRKAVEVLERQGHSDIVVIARDLDRSPGRLDALRKGATKARSDGTAVVAAMEPEAEAWRICAFLPSTPNEATRYQELVSMLTFDPVKNPARMSSTSRANQARDVKTVHAQLFDEDTERSHASLGRPIVELRTVATTCGLPMFIDEFGDAIAAAAARRVAE